ncbi:MAG: hypothetical protein U0570_04875 [Phycisphaerales bacterium]
MRFSEFAAFICCVFFAFQVAADPCDGAWLPGKGVPGINGTVFASILWDPDGPGPCGEQLVVGGEFAWAGSTPAANIAMWDGSHWTAFSSGVSGAPVTSRVYALAKLPDGSLAVGGRFTTAGNVAANSIARWDGSQWSALGSGLTDSSSTPSVRALCVNSGLLYAGGVFNTAGGVAAANIAAWNGSDWSALGAGTNGTVRALVNAPTGELVAAGEFTSVNRTQGSNSIAKWTGTAWARMGSPGTTPYTALAVAATGEIYAANTVLVRKWGGASWSILGTTFGSTVNALVCTSTGQVFAGGAFATVGGAPAQGIAVWDGAAWKAVGSGVAGGSSTSTVYSLLDSPQGLFVGGYFNTAGNKAAVSIARWHGETWHAIDAGFNSEISVLAANPDGGLIAGGYFAQGVDSAGLAFWNGVEWSGPGADVSGISNPVVAAVLADSPGEIVIGGRFLVAGGQSANYVARKVGNVWSSFGSGMDKGVSALVRLPSGDIVAGGAFTMAGGNAAACVARWDGAGWVPIGAGFNGSVACLAVRGTELFASGTFSASGLNTTGTIARWTGTEWVGLGDGLNSTVNALAVTTNGDLIAGGTFTQSGAISVKRIAKWNGTVWSPLGSGMNNTVMCLAAGPGGSIVAGGGFTLADNVPVNGIAQWDGFAWHPLAGGLTGQNAVTSVTPLVRAVVVLPSGEIAAGGSFQEADGMASAFFARWSPDQRPVIAFQPQPDTVVSTQTAEFRAAPANGYQGVSFQWKRDGQPIESGPQGASPGGGTVSGASGLLQSPTSASETVLSITGAQASDAGIYTVAFSNSCGEMESHVATLTVQPACSGDLNQDGQVDDADFIIFVPAYNLLLCDEPSMPPGCPSDLNTDGFVDDADFMLFVNAYDQLVCP